MLLLASYLDPRFKDLYCCTLSEKKEAKEKLMEVFSIIKENSEFKI